MPSRFDFVATGLAGLTVIRQKPHEDARGTFSRLYCADEFRAIGMIRVISQINHSLTRRKGTVRGLHFQRPPHAEVKIVQCLKGEVFDVAVDLRRGSATFLHWHGERLSAADRNALYIPGGFAHGFQALSDDCELLYLHAGAYVPESEDAINAADPQLGIAWPLPMAGLSERDRSHPLLTPDFAGIEL